MDSNITLLKQTSQLIGIHTIIRDRNCTMKDFIFYSDRLIRLVIEEALTLTPVIEKTVITPTNCEYKGVEFKRKICGVSIVRAGESFEAGLRSVCQSIKIGKILIQRDHETSKPIMYYSKLPSDIKDRLVFLMDPMIATSGSACMAINTLIENGVTEKNIIFLNLISCPEGLKKLRETYPDVRIVTSAIDSHLNENNYIMPGIGDAGDRYYSGTY